MASENKLTRASSAGMCRSVYFVVKNPTFPVIENIKQNTKLLAANFQTDFWWRVKHSPSCSKYFIINDYLPLFTYILQNNRDKDLTIYILSTSPKGVVSHRGRNDDSTTRLGAGFRPRKGSRGPAFPSPRHRDPLHERKPAGRHQQRSENGDSINQWGEAGDRFVVQPVPWVILFHWPFLFS